MHLHSVYEAPEVLTRRIAPGTRSTASEEASALVPTFPSQGGKHRRSVVTPLAPHLKPLVTDLARRAMASSGDQGWEVEAFEGDPSSAKDVLRFWRWRRADHVFYSFFRKDIVICGPGDHGKTLGVWVGVEWYDRPHYASPGSTDGYFAGELAIADLVTVPTTGQLELAVSA